MSRPPTCTRPAPIRCPIAADPAGWVGVDLGLTTSWWPPTPPGTVARVADAPKALATRLNRQRRLAKNPPRKQKRSNNRHDAAAQLGRHHDHVAQLRRHALHQVSNPLVKTHDRLALEDRNVSGMLGNHRLARAVSDAAWAEFARLDCGYKQAWRGGPGTAVDRWFPSRKRCPACGATSPTYRWHIGRSPAGADIPLTATATPRSTSPTGARQNELSPRPRTPKHGGRVKNARRGTALTSTPRVPVKPAPKTREPTVTRTRSLTTGTPENGAVEHQPSCSTGFKV